MATWFTSRYPEQVRLAQAEALARWRHGLPPPPEAEWRRQMRRLSLAAAACGTAVAAGLVVWAMRAGPLPAVAGMAVALLLSLHLATVVDRWPVMALAFALPLLAGAAVAVALLPHMALVLAGWALIALHGLATFHLLARNWQRFTEGVEQRVEHERLAAMLREQREIAERAVQQHTRFLASASHDLRQPMHAISLYLDGLAALTLPAPARDAVADARLCAHDMNDMFRSLLDLSRLDAQQAVPAPRVFAIATILERVESELRPLATARGTRLTVRPCTDLVFSDAAMVERIALNFASNAVRHAGGRRVLLACRRRGDMLRLAVHDNGPGIPESQQDAIFSEFHRLDTAAPRDAGGGLGLGLAIVRRLARTLRLPVTVRSALGRGSVFAVDLPLAHAPRPPAPAGAAPARLAGLLVVAIDDDPSILQAMAFLLQGAGCEVVAARSGETARRALATATRAPDAIVCDYQLHGTSDGDGDGDGGAVIAHLREEFNAEIPALLVTGHTAGGAAEAAARDLGVPLLHKPLDAAALKAALETILHA